ncbi:hypothetical protein GDO86_008005 [Hymenochirus boettgeri]|uniref:Fibronectin type-III domain-containing protein n=1 Tax=Hymenochirus boettgeri TaxID=247094 RepID=A0A8T2J1F1_9PIPI|nr:hypothetical protein GDO86_008005 [Hymenochirus boettgeri]
MESRLERKKLVFNFTILWFLVKMISEQFTSGSITVSPGTLLPLLSSVNVTCSQPKIVENLNIRKTSTFHKSEEVIRHLSNTNFISVNDTIVVPGRTTYICRIKDKIVSGIYVEVGNPPDPPQILSCEQEGDSGNMSCSWDTGTDTYIQTNYTLQLWQRRDNQNVPITCVNRSGEYIAVVTASNGLGNSSSLPYTFTFFDAVRPHPPNKTISFHPITSNCIVIFEDTQGASNFRIRYRPAELSEWKMVEINGERTHTLTDLQPFTSYEFQASCKFLSDRGKWSKWSQPVIKQTPEGVPCGKLDVWYKCQEISGNAGNIFLFWKPMNISQAKGQIQHYKVLYYRGSYLASVNSLKNISPETVYTTNDTWLARYSNKTEYVVSVTAHNSKGSSPSTYINVTTPCILDLPSPVNVVARSSSLNSMTVSWEIPQSSLFFNVDYIVEWEEQGGAHPNSTNWMKVSSINSAATISGNLLPFMCYEFSVYPLWKGRAGIPAKTRGAIRQEAPQMGPEFYVAVNKDKSILITWKEIPVEKQMGCIVQYTIYMQNPFFYSQSTSELVLCAQVTYRTAFIYHNIASTTAGESPKSLAQQIYIDGPATYNDYLNFYVLVTLPLAFVVCCICCIPQLRQRLQLFLSGCNKNVPDPANCTWVSEFTPSTDKVGQYSSALSSTSTYDETETLEVEEIDSENEAEFPPPTYILRRAEAEAMETLNVDKVLSQTAERVPADFPMQFLKGFYRSFLTNGPSSDYVENLDINMDYLPTNLLNRVDENGKEDRNIFHNEIFTPTLLITEGMLRLDAVKICSFDMED